MAVVRRELSAMKDQFESALPRHMPVDRFNRVVMTGIQNNPDLLDCDRKSLWNACMKAAQDGLLPDGREGALVPYKREVQWIPMVGGILKKIRNSGQLKSMTTKCILHGEEFDYRITHEGEQLLHIPTFSDDVVPDEESIRGVYCIARTKDDATYILVMSKAQIDKVRAVSRARRGGPWFDWYDQMAEKTVIRRLSKRLPISSDLDDLIRRDDHMYDMDLSADEIPADNLLGTDRPTRDQPGESDKTENWFEKGRQARDDGVGFRDAPRDLAAVDYNDWADGWENRDKELRAKESELKTQEVEDVEDLNEKPKAKAKGKAKAKPKDPDPPHDPETGEIDPDVEQAHEDDPDGVLEDQARKSKEEVIEGTPENITPATQAYRDGHQAFRDGVSIFKVPTELSGELTNAWRNGWEAAEKEGA